MNTHTEIAKLLDKLKLFLAVSQLAYLIRCCEVSYQQVLSVRRRIGRLKDRCVAERS